jgi:hypothetical protein
MVDLPHAGTQQQSQDERDSQLSGQYVVVAALQVSAPNRIRSVLRTADAASRKNTIGYAMKYL